MTETRSASASLSEAPELQQLALNFLATVLVVTLQNNNRHTSAFCTRPENYSHT